MELEFDKEIDAILRKGAREPAVAGSLKSAHLEPDAIAAFAENALPAAARSFYTSHLANCDRCRSILAQTISLHEEADMQAASSAVKTGTATEIRIPWYRKLFAIPNLAASLGMLVIVFAGLFGYILYQKNAEPGSSDVSKLYKPEPAMNKSASESEPSAASSNSMVSNTANSAANSTEPFITSGGSPMTKQIGQEGPDQPVIGENKPADDDAKLRDVEKDETGGQPLSPPASAPPVLREEKPKSEAADKVVVAGRKAETEDSKKKLELDGASTTDTAKAARKDEPVQNLPLNGRQIQNNSSAGGMMKQKSGPYRDMQQNSAVIPDTLARAKEDSAERRVAGKTFSKKDGVWYDAKYHGQTTIDIRRGTGEYRILDNGLRNLAESLSGTIVVVWKGKSYRIQ